MPEEFKKVAEFKMDDDGGEIAQLPLIIRQRVHKELTELLPEFDEFIDNDNDGNCPGYKSEEWPATYMYDGKIFVILIGVMNSDLKTINKVMTFKVKKDNLNILLEESKKREI